MHRVGRSKRGWRNFRISKTTDFARFYEACKGFRNLFYGDRGIAAVDIIQINILQPKPLETVVQLLCQIGRFIVEQAVWILAVCYAAFAGDVKEGSRLRILCQIGTDVTL